MHYFQTFLLQAIKKGLKFFAIKDSFDIENLLWKKVLKNLPVNFPSPEDLSRFRFGGIVPYRAYCPLAKNLGSSITTFHVLNYHKIFIDKK